MSDLCSTYNRDWGSECVYPTLNVQEGGGQSDAIILRAAETGEALLDYAPLSIPQSRRSHRGETETGERGERPPSMIEGRAIPYRKPRQRATKKEKARRQEGKRQSGRWKDSWAIDFKVWFSLYFLATILAQAEEIHSPSLPHNSLLSWGESPRLRANN